jgi:hypothetical protein
MPRFEPIPKRFYPEKSEKPFDKCIMCEKYLLGEGTLYMIEKAYRRYPALDTEAVIFEYAICKECAENMRSELSEESRQRIDSYFAKNVDFEKRMRTMLDDKPDLDKYISSCAVKQTPAEQAEEYVICAQCDGCDIVYSAFPYMIGGEAMEEVSELLSLKTRDVLDDFIDRHLSGPPELRELFKSNKKLLLV